VNTQEAPNRPRAKLQRTCVVCGKKADKRGLLRVVRPPDGAVSFDPTGRAPGRGAYICSLECLEKARKEGRLARSLKTTMMKDDYDRVAAAISSALQSIDGGVKER
jgi:predicted RNA-binding protein YlxR (DUF448 family)